MLRELSRESWRAASRPARFFARLERREPDLPRAALGASLSVAFALVAAALALARATQSELEPILFALLVGGLVGWLLIAFLGGLVIVRLAQLDLRAWEIVAWSWVPAGPVALSLLPALLVAPLLALALGYALALGWHIALLHRALGAFAPAQRRRSLALYLVSVLLLPWGAFALLFGISVLGTR